MKTWRATVSQLAAITFLGTSATGGCVRRVQGSAEWNRRTAEDGVFVAVLDHLSAESHAERVLVRSRTSLGFVHAAAPDLFWKSFGESRVPNRAAVENFTRINQEPRSIERIGDTDSNVEVVADSVLSNLNGTDTRDLFGYWRRLRSRFGHGAIVVTLSRPGFDRERKEAVMVVSYACGSLCGAGYSVLLRRQAAGWSVARMVEMWVS